ncbi:hypothetical protein P9112_000135 [Eukaryota sp. TZLM1-RC]
MFILTTVRDCVAIPPHKFNQKLDNAIEDSINSRYSGKVLSNHGLCISLWELLEMSDPFIFPGKGESFSWVQFKILVWQPVVGEIVTGRVLSSSKDDGLTVSLGFFDEIQIPPSNMMPDTFFDEIDNLWVWTFNAEDEIELPIDVGHPITTRITNVSFPMSKPKVKPTGNMVIEPLEEEAPRSAISVTASIAETGLGMKDWWEQGGED